MFTRKGERKKKLACFRPRVNTTRERRGGNILDCCQISDSPRCGLDEPCVVKQQENVYIVQQAI